MKMNFRWLVAVLVLAGTMFASPNDRDRDRYPFGGLRNKPQPHHNMPEPGAMVMLTLTAGTIVGGVFARRRMQKQGS